MNYGYIRVSTDTQTVENQRFEIITFCQRQGIAIDGWIEETISGTKSYDKRKLGRLLKHVQEGDLIICAELSRLGRTLFMIMDILNICMSKGCRVWTIKDNYRLGDDIQSKVLAFAFGLSAEIERNLISQRTREALALRRAMGITLGRPKGSRNRREFLKLTRQEERIRDLLLKGFPYRVVALMLGVDRNTLHRHLHRYCPDLAANRHRALPAYRPIPCARNYTFIKDQLARGDSLPTIAKRQGVPPEALAVFVDTYLPEFSRRKPKPKPRPDPDEQFITPAAGQGSPAEQGSPNPPGLDSTSTS